MTDSELVFTLALVVLSLLGTIGNKDKSAGIWVLLLAVISVLMDIVDRLQLILEAI